MGSKPDYPGSGRWAETDWDAEYNVRRPPVLPQHGRCETCVFWCHALGGVCGITLDWDSARMRYAEDRCEHWQEHKDWAPWVMFAESQLPKERRMRGTMGISRA